MAKYSPIFFKESKPIAASENYKLAVLEASMPEAAHINQSLHALHLDYAESKQDAEIARVLVKNHFVEILKSYLGSENYPKVKQYLELKATEALNATNLFPSYASEKTQEISIDITLDPKFKYTLKELIQTEKNFNRLMQLIDNTLRGMAVKDPKNSETYEAIRSNISEVIHHSGILLSHLSKINTENTGSELFQTTKNALDPERLRQYVQNLGQFSRGYEHSHQMLKELSKERSIKKLLGEIFKDEARQMGFKKGEIANLNGLESQLINPVQRGPRLEMLMDAFAKILDKTAVKQASSEASGSESINNHPKPQVGFENLSNAVKAVLNYHNTKIADRELMSDFRAEVAAYEAQNAGFRLR